MVNLPNNIYDGGAVTFNSTPYTQFYLNELQKKRAKDEALDNYFQNFNKSINPSGMRTQDIEGGWMNKVNGWMDYYQKNKQSIQNPRLDNGKAYNQYMAMHNDLLGDVQKSKNLADVSKQYVVPIVSNPDKRTRLRDNGVNAIHQHDISMYDPQHKSLDPSVLEYGAKPFDLSAQKKLDDIAMKDVKMSNTIASVSVDPKTKNKITTYHSQYSPQDLQTIGGKYADAYHSDDSFANAVDDILHDTPDALDKYNHVFKAVYGREIQSNEDLAAAYGLSRVQQKISTQKGTAYSPFTPYDSEALAEKLFDYKKNGMQAEVNNTVDELVDKQIEAAADKLTNLWYAGAPAYLPADPATLRAMNVENLVLSDDKQHIIPEWSQDVKDGQGNVIGVKTVRGTPMTIDQYKAAIGKRDVGSKYFQKQGESKPTQTKISGSSTKSVKKYSVNGKAYTDDDLKKLGYTDDQIQQAIKLGTLKAQ